MLTSTQTDTHGRGSPPTLGRGPQRFQRPWIIGSLLFICILSGYLLSYNVDQPSHNGDWYLRYQVTCAIVEHNSFAIYPYQQDARSGPGANGDIYTEYTLGQSVAMIPLYMLGRVLAGVAHTDCSSDVAQPIVFLTCKTLDMILGALLSLLFFATARLLGCTPRRALALTLLLAFGTSLWPDVLSNLEHTMESLFLLAATYAALRYTLQRRKNGPWVLVMGLAAGLVFVTRVAGVIALPVFPLYLLVLHRHWRPGSSGSWWRGGWWRPFGRDVALYAVGVLPSVTINAVYDLLRFGSPLRTGPYPDHSLGFPPWFGLPDLLISPGKGLFWYTPAIFLLVLALRPFWRRFRLPAILFAIICGVYLLFYSNVTYWHGDPAWGPRYLYAILPYLILPLGEIFRRWSSYRAAVRGVVVAVLAASFLVQFTAATVSFWRHFHLIFGYYPAQVAFYSWGFDMNYFWNPSQSPIVTSLASIADITHNYVAHAPLLQHNDWSGLSSGNENCIYHVFVQGFICLTDADGLHYRETWNTFAPWWLHIYPWWSEGQVIGIALALLGVFLLSGGLLLRLLKRPARPLNGAPVMAPAMAPPVALSPAPISAHSDGPERDKEIWERRDRGDRGPSPALATSLEGKIALMSAPAAAPGESASGAAVAACPSTPSTGLRIVGLALVGAIVVYGGIVAAAALRSWPPLPPLVRQVAMHTTVHDGTWDYQVVGVAHLLVRPDQQPYQAGGYHYELIQLRLHNLSSRPNSLALSYFRLTDMNGMPFAMSRYLDQQLAELYHVTPVWYDVPAHSVVVRWISFHVPDTASSHLALLGPGIALVQLDDVGTASTTGTASTLGSVGSVALAPPAAGTASHLPRRARTAATISSS